MKKLVLIMLLLYGSASAQFSSPAGLRYFTETDDTDTSVFVANGPNTTIGFNDDLTTMGHDITGLQGLTAPGTLYFVLNGDTAYISSSEFNLGGNIATGGVNFITGVGGLYGWAVGDLEIRADTDSNIILYTGTGDVFRNTDLYADSAYMTKKYIDDVAGATDSVGKAYGDDQGNRIVTTYLPINGSVSMVANWLFGDFDLTGAEAIEADTVTATVALNTPEINVTGATSGTITLSGATSGSASITVADEAGTPSEIVLPTSDGSNGYQLTTNGSGVTSWAAVTDSVGKAYGDASGNQITTTYLPLAGGTLTGNLGMPGYFINEILAIDGDSGFYVENVEDAGFRSYVQFDLDKMYIGATNVSNVRERVWQFFLSDLTGLTPASLGTPTITGNVDWKANPVPYTYIAANAIDSTKVVAASLSMSADMHAFSSADLLGRLGDETGSGVAVFGTSPTFTTDITSPLIIGGTGTTSDLSLKTTSGVGTTGADMHFLVGNDGATEAMTILNDGKVGIGTNAPTAPLEVEGIFQGTVGGFPSGLFHVTRGGDAEFANAVITGHNTYNTNTQLWYLGSTSSGNYDIGLINRQNGKMYFATNNANRMVIDATGYVGIGGTLSPPERLSVVGNIATGDTTAGDIDVYHYFSTNGSWTTEYMMWNDGDAGFQLSDDLDVTGTIKSDDTLFYTFILADPDALYTKDTQWGFNPETEYAITIRSIYVSLDADPTTEMTYSIVFCDAGVGWVSPTTVDDTATVAGVTDVTGGFGDATIPAGKKLYFLFDADPDDAITQADIKIGYTVD